MKKGFRYETKGLVDLNAIDSSKWPFSMVFDRFITKTSSFFFPRKHAVIPAIGLAVPLFPS